MRIIAIEKELSEHEPLGCRELLSEEAACIWALQQRGVLRDIWFTRDDHRAVLMLECASEDEAREILTGLPLVQEQIINFEVHGLCPYDGFARLFETHV